MNNLEALSRLCTAIVNTFYPDNAVLELTLFNEGVDPAADAQQKDAVIFRCAVRLVRGYVESSRSEGPVSVSVNPDAVEKALSYWCRTYGLDAEEELADGKRIISDATNLW